MNYGKSCTDLGSNITVSYQQRHASYLFTPLLLYCTFLSLLLLTIKLDMQK